MFSERSTGLGKSSQDLSTKFPMKCNKNQDCALTRSLARSPAVLSLVPRSLARLLSRLLAPSLPRSPSRSLARSLARPLDRGERRRREGRAGREDEGRACVRETERGREEREGGGERATERERERDEVRGRERGGGGWVQVAGKTASFRYISYTIINFLIPLHTFYIPSNTLKYPQIPLYTFM